jgi:hypothetical protein
MDVPLGGVVDPALPAIRAGDRTLHLGAGRQPLADQGLGDAARVSFGWKGGGDQVGGRGRHRAQEGTLVSSPVFPSLMGTIAVRQPLLKVTMIRLLWPSALIESMSLANLLRA